MFRRCGTDEPCKKNMFYKPLGRKVTQQDTAHSNVVATSGNTATTVHNVTFRIKWLLLLLEHPC